MGKASSDGEELQEPSAPILDGNIAAIQKKADFAAIKGKSFKNPCTLCMN